MRKERRQFRRVPHPIDVRYHTFGWGESWTNATLINLSAGGIRLRSDEPLEPGSQIELRLGLPNAPEPLAVQGRVMWSQALAAGANEHGIEFQGGTPEKQERVDELVRFLSKVAPPSPASE